MALSSLLLFTSLSAFGYNDGIVDASGEVIATQAEPDPSASVAVWVKGKGEQLVHRAAIGEWGSCRPYMWSKTPVAGGTPAKFGRWLKPGYEHRWNKMAGGNQCRKV